MMMGTWNWNKSIDMGACRPVLQTAANARARPRNEVDRDGGGQVSRPSRRVCNGAS